MQESELQQYLLRNYPQENARCEWKEFKNLNLSSTYKCNFLGADNKQ